MRSNPSYYAEGKALARMAGTASFAGAHWSWRNAAVPAAARSTTPKSTEFCITSMKILFPCAFFSARRAWTQRRFAICRIAELHSAERQISQTRSAWPRPADGKSAMQQNTIPRHFGCGFAAPCVYLAILAAAGETPALRSIWATRPRQPLPLTFSRMSSGFHPWFRFPTRMCDEWTMMKPKVWPARLVCKS